MEVTKLGDVGYVKDGTDVYSFQIGNTLTEPTTVNPILANNVGPVLLNVDNASVLAHGEYNNLPEEINQMIKDNSFLPRILEKQITILYGKGLRTYRNVIDKDNKVKREWVDDIDIINFFENMENTGNSSVQELAMKVVRRFYYFEEFYIKWLLKDTRLLDPQQRDKMKLSPPIYGMELIENKRSRLATKKQIDLFNEDLEYSDFDSVIVGNWTRGLRRNFKTYRRTNLADILKRRVSISQFKNDAVDSFYGVNKFYAGAKNWINASNLTPRNINSFIKHSLAAKVHIIVPNEWCDAKRDMLSKYCRINADRKDTDPEATLIKVNDIEIGTEYHEHLFNLYFKAEIKKFVNFMSGPDNQGKAHASISFSGKDGQEVRWKVEPIDLKYKEYIESLSDYHKLASDELTRAVGVDGSITGITKDGVISKSGADLYYNYLIYLFQLPIVEEICSKPFNWLLKINFPQKYNSGLRCGYYNEIPQRQEDTAPNDRLQNNINQAVQNALFKMMPELIHKN